MLYVMFCHIFKISEKNTDDPMCPEEEKETREWHYDLRVKNISFDLCVQYG